MRENTHFSGRRHVGPTAWFSLIINIFNLLSKTKKNTKKNVTSVYTWTSRDYGFNGPAMLLAVDKVGCQPLQFIDQKLIHADFQIKGRQGNSTQYCEHCRLVSPIRVIHPVPRPSRTSLGILVFNTSLSTSRVANVHCSWLSYRESKIGLQQGNQAEQCSHMNTQRRIVF